MQKKEALEENQEHQRFYFAKYTLVLRAFLRLFESWIFFCFFLFAFVNSHS